MSATPPATSELLSKDLTFLIMQCLQEDKLKETLHQLEQESGCYFNMKYFEELLLAGKFDEVETYLSGFTKVEDNRYSMKIFFEIRKQKYLEALDKHDRATAVEILVKDLKVFAGFNEDLYKEITQLLTLSNFRQNGQLSTYADTRTARAILAQELKKLVESNPSLRDKLQFPSLTHSRLRTLINQSINWQHALCPIPIPNPDIKSLFVDHTCGSPSDIFAHLAANGQAQKMGSLQRANGLPPIGLNGSFQPSISPIPIQPPLSTWMEVPVDVNMLTSSSGGGIPFGRREAYYSRLVSEHMTNTRFPGVINRGMMSGFSPGQTQSTSYNAIEDFPGTVSRILNQGSNPTCMDFHPVHQTILLVGTNIGDTSVWEISSKEKLVSKSFQPWNMGTMSIILKATLVKDPSISVKRVLWSPDGSLFGVALSKHMVQLYTYFGGDDLRQHLEIDAHVGSVNDLAFCCPKKQLCVITCGDDKTIKVWDVATGSKLYTFEGHEAPVHSVCPHNKDNVHFVFSTSVDGQIKAWLYEVEGPSWVNYDAPGLSCTAMVYSADGKRLFSSGTSKDGESHVVEWNENEGTIKMVYQGFPRNSLGVIQLNTTRNKYLAVGDENAIKVWDMDNVNLLATIDAEGGLPATPCIRFNKAGALLAVSANDNRIKVLATPDGLRLMRGCENISRNAQERSGCTRIMEDKKPRLAKEVNTSKHTEINESARLQSLRLSTETEKISRLVYTSSGNAILALASNGTHLLWRWPRGDASMGAKATTKITPQLMQPTSGIQMINDLTGAKPEEAIPCFALSKNDSYIMSASGGQISLFNLMTFKTMITFMPPPPMVTCLALHPEDNNIVAVGFDDSTINIYNVRTNEVKLKLEGHSKRVTGLTFSQLLMTFVSTGADAQIIVWSYDTWERKNNCFLQIPVGTPPTEVSGTHVQYHKDHNQFLIVHETQIAIYETSRLECQKKWLVGDSSAPISYATFSCDSQSVYASFLDGTVRVFTASNLQVQCQINPNAYLPSKASTATYAIVIATNPQEPNQFAMGLTDGAVVILEPLESGDKWGMPPPAYNPSLSIVTSIGTNLGQMQS